VYDRIDPVTRKRRHLTEIIPPGPGAAKEAEKARTRLPSKVDEQRNPRTRATVKPRARPAPGDARCRGHDARQRPGFVRNHIRPLIGDVPLGRINDDRRAPR